jgi:hypothetical protein
MWHFLARYFGWYLWLAAYCTIIGALVGLACCAVFLLPFILIFIVYLLPVAVAYAAPLNMLVFPLAFHCLRNGRRRLVFLQAVGLLAGFVSPGLVMLTAELADPAKTSSAARALLLAQDNPVRLALLSVAGALAGIVCAKLFHKHGDKPSIFDVNAQLEALRKDQTLHGR